MGLFSWLSGGKNERNDDGKMAILSGDGSFRLDVVGESNYQDALDRVCGGRTVDGVQMEVDVILVPDDNNPYDDQAVAVTVDGELVGYLDRNTAPSYRSQLEKVVGRVRPAVCKGLIVGGWDRGINDRGHFGIKLDLPTD